MTKKLFFLLLLTAFCLTSPTQTHRKSTVAAASITLNNDATATVLEWFNFIEEKGVVLSYNAANIHLHEKVKVKQNTYSIEELLSCILAGYDFETNGVEKKILLQVKGPKHISISGMVYDQSTNEPLEGCMVVFMTKHQKRYATTTDANGIFRKELPSDPLSLSASYIGYEPTVKGLLTGKNQYIRIGMRQTAIAMNEVKVMNSPMGDAVNYKGASSKLSVNGNDPFAQIHSLPGIHGSAVGGSMHVNGGQDDENLILLDGIPIYHSHHNNILLSQFNGETVERISFYDSFIPAQYEGRLSSVTDVKIKVGDSTVHHQSIGVELPAAALTLDGPIIKNKLTYMIAGRHSWMDFMKDLFSDNASASRVFNDLTGKLHYRISPKLAIEGLIYRSRDEYKDSIHQNRSHKILAWENSLYSVSSHTVWPGRISNTTAVSVSKYYNSIYGPAINIPSDIFIGEGMTRISVKSDFTKAVDQYMTLLWGLSFGHEQYNLLASQDTVKNNIQKIVQVSGYINSRIKITEQLYGSVALNLLSYRPKNSQSFFSMQPRFTLKYAAGNRNIFFVDFSRMEQFYHNICVGEIPIPTDLRMPSIDGFRPSSSVHGEIGWKHIDSHWRLSGSTYYKRRYHILGIRYDIFNTGEEGWNQFIMKGNGESYGIKIHSMNQWNKWRLNCSYTFSKSVEWFEDYENNKKNPSLHDIPHLLHCAASYEVGANAFVTFGGYVKSGTLYNVYHEEGNVSGQFISHRERRKANYRLDANFSGVIVPQKQLLRFSYKVGLYNIVGNPKEEEIIDLYTTDAKKHCLPYFSLHLKF